MTVRRLVFLVATATNIRARSVCCAPYIFLSGARVAVSKTARCFSQLEGKNDEQDSEDQCVRSNPPDQDERARGRKERYGNAKSDRRNTSENQQPFNYQPIDAYLNAHRRSKVVRVSEVFPSRDRLLKSDFYRQYMAPHKCRYALGLFFLAVQG
jgi:hypothetical protein